MRRCRRRAEYDGCGTICLAPPARTRLEGVLEKLSAQLFIIGRIVGLLQCRTPRSEIERRRGEVEVGVELMLNGFGQGRGALLKALSMAEGDGIRDAVTRITDKTPIRIGGVRLQKKRRL